ncbi:stalk domain-containing protein [Cohnella rhizosphaerae]|uniref:Stalk domain-containing protein n=1 Tax=Cohnella rhizosphaerae TaxID=1457232 RepID=A0A9X4KPL2_9BACL|nr:stalk domain-containing protein [Cohnella rhizosphaerae]MDG0808470.1 stalk domain-containing protein [Cohnella rhizosphaerae]
MRLHVRSSSKKGVTYVALRFMAERLQGSLSADPATGETVLSARGISLKYKPGSKQFKVDGAARAMNGAPYADRYVLMVPLTSIAQGLNLPLSASGSSLVLQLGAPHALPQAYFEMDKPSYKIGEPVQFFDLSTDAEGAIVTRSWTGKQAAYFEPGDLTVTLTVKDRYGSMSAYSRTIHIEDKALYTKETFDLLYAPVGQNIAVDGVGVKTMEALPYSYRTEGPILLRSSGPETVYEEGILYGDVATGPVRFLLHHKNGSGRKMKLHILATNAGAAAATLTPGPAGAAGPTIAPGQAGKMSLARYLSALEAGDADPAILLEPGQSALLFDNLESLPAMPDGDVVTFTGEVGSDAEIRYTVLITTEGRDPLLSLPNLPALDPREWIVRGTFEGATRTFDYAEPVGGRMVKLSLTDNAADPFQEGTDGILNTAAVNSGNYGLLYRVKLRKVAPRTLIVFNPRGGMYAGAALVNGRTVTFSHLGAAGIQNEASVLYRTGDAEEEVDIAISPAAGSNLPFCLLFVPMPDASGG